MATSQNTQTASQPGLLRVLLALFLFAVAFAWVESSVVVYLRGLYEPLHQRFYPDLPAGEMFPLIRLDQLEEAGPEPMRWLGIELVREAATLVMLAAVALAFARNFRQWFAGFLVAFGIWDIFYYVFLKLLLDWPESLQTWDLLFLLPVPWAGPVLAPVLVAQLMIVTGVITLQQEWSGRPIRLTWAAWAAMLAGGALIVLAFCWDYRHLLAGGEPTEFPWLLFGMGGGLGLASFLHALGRQGDGGESVGEVREILSGMKPFPGIHDRPPVRYWSRRAKFIVWLLTVFAFTGCLWGVRADDEGGMASLGICLCAAPALLLVILLGLFLDS